MQRFGTYSIRTHEIGIEILKGNWEEACRLIIQQTSGPRDKARKD